MTSTDDHKPQSSLTEHNANAFAGTEPYENWLRDLNCKILEIRGDTPVNERLAMVKEQINELMALGRSH